jgi:DNA (cytosine-5)-methyltransferase 1
MKKRFLVADLLCGAGGSSTGCKRALDALGLEMDLVCVNHWDVAIATHQANHPTARHFVQDIATVRPSHLVPEGYLDLLLASPSCVYHSRARAGRPTSDQQRSDPWHIITWLTELQVKRIIIENVWEFIDWGPVDPETGKPDPERKGAYFTAWREAIERLGFQTEFFRLNAADYGSHSTRERFIMMGRSDGEPIRWPARTHAKNPHPIKEPHLQRWKPAADIIDWSLRGASIFDRKRPLAPKTLSRIYIGIVRHGWPQGCVDRLVGHMTSRNIPIPVLGPRMRVASPDIQSQALVLPQHGQSALRPVDAPLPTITTGGAGAKIRPGCARPAVVEPFILSQGAGGAARPVSEPTPTIPGGGAHALVAPYYGDGSGLSCTSADGPLPTVTTKARFAVVMPVTQASGGAAARGVDQPIPTITGAKRGEFALVMPLTHTDRSDRTRNALTTPAPTTTGANRGELAIVTGEESALPEDAYSTGLQMTAPADSAPNYDIYLRMMDPSELSAAMGLTRPGREYRFTGTKTEQIKQIGNAVSVEKMEACVRALCADAADDADRSLATQTRRAA